MASPETTTPIGVTAALLPALRDGGRSGTAVVSVYLGLDQAIENASLKNQRAWLNHRRRLSDEGASEAALATVDSFVPGAHHEGATLVVFADGDGLLHHSMHEPRITTDVARVGALPALVPIVGLLQRDVPHVRARIDRAAAEIDAIVGARRHEYALAPHDAPEGQLRRSKPGGWSQRRYQQRAENLWAEHGRQFADALVEAVDDVRARFVAMAGDVRAVQLTTDALPDRVRPLVVHVPGSRHADGSDEAFVTAVAGLVEDAVAHDTATVLEQLAQEFGEEDRAAVGVPAVFAALAEAEVGRLLVAEDADDDRMAWFGEGNLVAVEQSTLTAFGVTIPMEARMADVAIHAALNSGASVRIVPARSLVDGFSALLRFP
jgi:hypothetical protein